MLGMLIGEINVRFKIEKMTCYEDIMLWIPEKKVQLLHD